MSSEQKLDFCDLLKQMKNKQNIKEKVELVYIHEKNNVSSKYSSMLLALSSFTMVLTTTLLITKEVKTHAFDLFKENISLVLVATFVPILAMIITSLYGIIYKKHVQQTASKKELKNMDEEIGKV